MARTGDDSWDLASSVGVTATMVAAGRAVATADGRGLIDDPYAAPLVRAVGINFFDDALDGKFDGFGDVAPAEIQAQMDEMVVRTRFFDDYFRDATDAGIRQAVILASGLDARAYRLNWPAGTVVYEIDQPAVVAFKTQTLSDLGAEPSCIRRTVAIDLREDWMSALRDNGFDPSIPTAWLAEGLLIYLPPGAQDTLFGDIITLSAPGSRIATEFVPKLVDFDTDRAREAAARFRGRGLDIDMPSLIYPGPRVSATQYFGSRGWRATGVPGSELFRRLGLTAPDYERDNALGEIVYINAELPTQNR